jgi:DNA helicase-2/ATP-dependent DNA helicase PcrA
VAKRAKPGIEKFARVLRSMTQDDVREKAGEMIRVLLEDFYSEVLARTQANARERIDEIEQLADYAGGFADLETFLSELALVQSFAAEEVVAAEDPDEKITLSSVHQAKGLEWSRVFLVWLADGAFPSDLALKDPHGEDEERRLFYVGVTRAKDELYLVHPLVTRSRDTSMVLHRSSRFIDELPKPGVDDHGELTGVYEPWEIEVVKAPPQLELVPAEALAPEVLESDADEPRMLEE